MKEVLKIEVQVLVNELNLKLMKNNSEGARATIDDLKATLDKLNNLLLEEEGE